MRGPAIKRRALGLLGLGLAGPLAAEAGSLRVLLNPLGRLTYLENGRPAGALPELMRELARRCGLALDLQVLPRARVAAMFAQG